MKKPRLLIFASGTKDGGGSGFRKLVLASRSEVLSAEIVGVVGNHADGGVRRIAEELGIRFFYFPGPYDAGGYSALVQKVRAEYVALSGWLKLVLGLDPSKTFNIHPALLSQLNGRFGGKGMYSHHVHEAVEKALDAGEITESGFSMHFVTPEYDRGPVFYERRVVLHPGMTAEEIGKVVNDEEHSLQAAITNLVVNGKVRWDGKNPRSLICEGLEIYNKLRG